MDDEEAVEALKELGLSTYEARVFSALVRLGGGTARDVAEVTEVPRPQVYTATDDLERRGFVSIRQSNPQVFHPVSLDEARAQLERRFERQRDAAFDHLAAVERTVEGEEQSEDVWSLTGETAIVERIAQLAADADRTVYYGATDLVEPDPDLLEAFARVCDRGAEVVLLVERDQSVGAAWDALDCVRELRMAAEDQSNEYAEQVLIVDFDVFLLSIRGGGTDEETAIWSAHTTFAQVLARLVVGSFPGAETDGERIE